MLHHFRKARTFLNIDREYELRRAVYRVLPAPAPQLPGLVHACTWKTGSQWVRLVLSDPRFYLRTGLSPYFLPSMGKEAGSIEGLRINEGSVVTSAMITYETYASFEKPQGAKVFFVVRDPRDLALSRFYSARYSHPDNPELIRVREQMRKMSEEDGLIYTITDRFEPVASRMKSWLAASKQNHIPIVRFENLTGKNQLDVWCSLLEKMEIDMPRNTMESILKFYRHDRMRPKSKTSQLKTAKYRSGRSGEWHEQFTDRVRDAFEKLYGDLPQQLGYE